MSTDISFSFILTTHVNLEDKVPGKRKLDNNLVNENAEKRACIDPSPDPLLKQEHPPQPIQVQVAPQLAQPPECALQLETPSSLLVIPDVWGQSHELGPILSSIFTKLRKEHGTTSFCVIWNGMREKYTKIDYVKSTKPNDPFLVHQKELNDAKSKFVYLMDITHTQMRKEGKGPISDAEEELWGLSSILGLLHLQEIHPIIGEDCNDDGQFRLRKLNELKGELRGQYRLLKDLNDIINGRWKIGISNRKVEGILRRIWEQLFPSSTDRSVEHEVEEEEGATGKFYLGSCFFWLPGR